MNILDIGVGSGMYSAFNFKRKKNFYGTGIDISKNCLNISKMNALQILE